MTPPLKDAVADWLARPGTAGVLAALEAAGGTVRFAGGCVRDGLIGRPVNDLDLATDLLPQQVVAALQAAGVRYRETGIEHGTVMAIAEHTPFEITTLRRDVSTDGRRAIVAFTNDWAEDAARRDFTINGMYADKDGALYDYVGGQGDIEAKRLNFIGDAVQRLREDYLRLLRLFRFASQLPDFEIVPDALLAAESEAAGLQQISAERISAELQKLLTGAGAVTALQLMHAHGVDRWVLHGGVDDTGIRAVGRLAEVEGARADPLRRLFVLAGAEWAVALAQDLRLSSRNQDRLLNMQRVHQQNGMFTSDVDDLGVDTLLYLFGPVAAVDGAFLRWASGPEDLSDLITRLESRPAPVFPVQGKDLLALGMAPGPKVGHVMQILDVWWVQNGFPPRADVLKKAEEILKGE